MTAPARRAAQAAHTADVARRPDQARASGRDAVLRIEAQADAAAQAVLRGERDVARRLAPGPLSVFPVPASRGEPIPTRLRAELEQSFGTTLHDVRIHRDDAAARAAASLGAAAFVSGLGVFFGEHQFDPEGERGRELIAHEIAHVLQQHVPGGRPSGGADGPVLRRDLSLEFTSRGLFETAPSLDAIIRLHLEASPTDVELRAHAERVGTLLGSARPAHPAAAELIAITAERDFTAAASHRAFYYDCLKAIGEHRAAAKVVRWTFPKLTAVPLNAFYASTLQRDAAWVPGVLRSHELTARYWPRRFVDTIRIFLFGPGRSEQDLGINETFATVYDDVLAAAENPAALVPSERFYYGLAALKELDDWRVASMAVIRAQVDSQDRVLDRISGRHSLATWLADAANIAALFPSAQLSAEAGRLVESAIDDIRAVAAAARDFWKRVSDLAESARKGGDFEDLGAGAKLIGEISNVPSLRGLEDDLLGVSRSIFHLPGGRTPSAGAYGAQLGAARRRVLGLTHRYDQTIIDLQRRAAAGEAVSDRLMLQHGWTVQFLAALHFVLGKFEPLARRKGESAAAKREREDSLVYHRLKLAQDLRAASGVLGFEKLDAFLASVLAAVQGGQQESEFAILGDWAEDTEAKPGEIVRDFPPGATLVGAEPLTIDDLARFNYALYAGALTSKLREVLAARGAVHSKGIPPIVNEALDAIETRDRPRRWLLTEFVAAIRPEERDQFGLMIAGHPTYQEFLSTRKPAGHEVVFPFPYGFHRGGLVLWTIPQIDDLVTKLKGIPGLDDGVRTVLGKEAPDALAWLGALKQVIELDPSIDAASIQAFIQADFDASVAELEVELRLATSHQRRVLLEHVLVPLWSTYASNDIHTFTRPLEAIRVMTDFSGHVQPPADQRLQMAALVTELGPLLYEKLGPQDVLFGLLETNVTGRLDIIVMLLPHLEGTLALAADEAARATLLKLNLHVPKGFDVHVGEVRKLKEGTAEHLFEVQTETQLAGSQAGNSLSSPGHGFPFLAGPENVIQIDGTEYELVEVYESFTYAPGVAMASGGVDWPASKLGESKLWDSSGTQVATEARADRRLFKIKRFDQEIVVNGADDRLLSELTHVVTMNAIVTQLLELGELITKAAELGLDLAELIPGWGQAIMVVRFVTNVLTFVTSEQFQDLKRALGGDSAELITQAFAELEELITPEKLWDWLLFGGGTWPAMAVLSPTDRQKKVAKRHQKGSAAARLGALVARLARVGQNLGMRVGALGDRFHYPVRRTQLFVQSRPMIAMVLRLMVDNYARLSNLKLAELELGPDLAQQRILDEMGQLSARISELLETIGELELPQEIIPLDQIVDVTLEIVTDHLGGKYKTGVKIIKAGLQRIPGAWEGIVAAVTDQLKAARMDPNILWQDLVRSDLEPHFEKLAGDFAETAGGTLARIPFLKGVAPPVGPTIDLNLEAGEFPETQPYLDGLPDFAGAGFAWPTEAGRRLDPRHVRQASLAFGADLSHVRVHTGAGAAALTGGLGARAVTSGSHVYLRPGLSIEQGPGAHVFRHELAHVVQQTGPRPLGGSAGDAPVAGRPDRGMHLSGAAEQAADRAAETAGREPIAHRPLDVGGRRGPAVQPSFDPRIEPVLKKFFGTLGADKPLQKFVEDIDRGRTGKAQLDARATRIKAGLPAKLDAELRDLGNARVRFEKPFDSAHVAIAKYIDERHRDAIRAAVAPLLVSSMRPKQVKSPAESGGTKQTTEWHFDHEWFEINLEEYLLGRSGVLFDIEFNLDRTGAGASPTEPMIDLERPFSTFKVLAVNFAYIGGTASLWDLIVQNTWETRTYVPRPKFKDLPLPVARALYKNRARMLIRSAGPDPRLFHGTEFCFSSDFVKRVEVAVTPPAGGLLPPERLPVWKEYLQALPREHTWNDASGYSALKHGVYEQAREGGEQWGLEREAHHSVPYLLLEYFRNLKPNKPFPRALSWYPGVSTSGGGLVERIEKRGGSRSIKVREYEENHGGKMPTVLISRHTHQLGRLHLDPKPDDAPGARPTQGGAMHDMYRTRLGEYAPIVLAGTTAKLEAVKKQTAGQTLKGTEAVVVGGRPVTLDVLQDAIYDAVVGTYTEVRNDMRGRLRAGLAHQEVEYYTATAKRSTHDAVYQASIDQLQPAYRAVAKDTEAVARLAEQDVQRVLEDPSLAGFEEKK